MLAFTSLIRYLSGYRACKINNLSDALVHWPTALSGGMVAGADVGLLIAADAMIVPGRRAERRCRRRNLSKGIAHAMADRPLSSNAALVPRALLDSVVAYFNPRRVIVFGSMARGDAGPDSDIDLLVTVDNDTPAERVTLKAGYESRKSYNEPADVIPVREAAFQRNATIAGTLSRAAILDGMVVYDRP